MRAVTLHKTCRLTHRVTSGDRNARTSPISIIMYVTCEGEETYLSIRINIIRRVSFREDPTYLPLNKEPLRRSRRGFDLSLAISFTLWFSSSGVTFSRKWFSSERLRFFTKATSIRDGAHTRCRRLRRSLLQWPPRVLASIAAY